MNPSLRTPTLPGTVTKILEEFRDAYGEEASVWARTPDGWVRAAPPGEERADELPSGAVPVRVLDGTGVAVLVRGVDGPRHGRFLAPVLALALKHEKESRAFGKEIGERYEEITLLYSISEILGSVISLEQAARTILREVAGTLNVQRATLWLHEPDERKLVLIAAHGSPGPTTPIDVDDEAAIAAAAFRDRLPINVEPDQQVEQKAAAPDASPHRSLLSVPVIYNPPEGEARTIGVINLVGRDPEHRFLADDQKLMMAIASQIGAAVENSRLVAASLRQERMVREMELAHDLQMKLLPTLEQFEGYAEVAARCVPADSVGGDFYHLFRLPGGRLGVMIGDVSSHGFAAALIMALTMSAVAIHASEGDSPSEVLRRTHRTLIDELETTEMFLTLFYGVIDPGRGQLVFANAGHAQAFILRGPGDSERLNATNPPLGIVDLDAYGEETTRWEGGKDLLLLFTDGLSDALDLGEIRGQQRVLDEAVSHRTRPVADILQHLYDLPSAESLRVDDRTAVLVRF